MIRPLPLDNAQAVFYMGLDRRIHRPRIDEAELQKMLQPHLSWQHDFEIVRRMQRVFVVLGVAGPEHDMAAPAQKAEQPQKKVVQQARLEHCIVAKLVGGVEQKNIKRAIS